MMSQPKFSIVTIVLNRREYTRQAIECILAQNYPNFEHIVIDGGSTDGTVEMLKSYPHLRWISEKDGGSVFALNKGLAMVTGDIWGWLNSDESYLPGVFQKAADYFEAHPDWDMIYGASEFVNQNGDLLGRRRSQTFSLHRLLVGFNQIAAPSSMFMRRRVLDGIGGRVDERWKHTYDHDLWIRVAKRFRVQNVPDCFSRFGLHGDSGVAGTPHHALAELKLLRTHHGGDKEWLDRVLWVPYFNFYRWVYSWLKWRRMLRGAGVNPKK